MKAKVKVALPGYAGNMDDVVIYFNPKLNKMITRRKVKPAHSPSNTNFSAVCRLAKTLGISEGYIGDCRRYVDLYNRKNRRSDRYLYTWRNVFIRLMLQLKKIHPELDLATLTKEQIYAAGYPCTSIALAVRQNLLEKVPGHADLVNLM